MVCSIFYGISRKNKPVVDIFIKGFRLKLIERVDTFDEVE
jgi:hypothetical protein